MSKVAPSPFHEWSRKIGMSVTYTRLPRRALRLEGVTAGWDLAEGAIAVIAGWTAASIALVGFGADSFIETTSASVVGWRLWQEMRARSSERVETIEHSSGWWWADPLAAMVLVPLIVREGIEGWTDSNECCPRL
jgi:hypothetical protein